MKKKRQLLGLGLLFILISVMSVQTVRAQYTHEHKFKSPWRTGMLVVSKSVWAGSVRLKNGMYHVKHVTDGDRHQIVFNSVRLPAGKGFPMWEEKEVARLECGVQPVMKSVSNTKVIWTRNTVGEPAIAEIQIAGEKFKHVIATAPTD